SVAESPPPAAAVGMPAPADDVDPKVVEAALTEAARLTKAGEFDAATAKLDEIRGLTQALPTLAGRIERADSNVSIGRLMAAGSTFEHQDNKDAATEAYRDALELDPSYMPAREALARLDVDAGPPPEGTDAIAFGQVKINSKPGTAKIYIDGNPAGTTPFEGKLRVGEHEVRIVARGYFAYNETIKVREEDETLLSLTLKGRGKSSKGHKDDPEPAKTDKPASTPTKPPKADPKTDADTGKSNPFLPTKGKPKNDDKPKSGNPFLPTKD
nr:PEGA domain-containing protein [Deltaproteobacteria bacterium]